MCAGWRCFDASLCASTGVPSRLRAVLPFLVVPLAERFKLDATVDGCSVLEDPRAVESTTSSLYRSHNV